jgi:hypothetical protein
MSKPKRKAAPVTFVDFDCVPKDTSADEKTDSDEEEILKALDQESYSSEESSEKVEDANSSTSEEKTPIVKVTSSTKAVMRNFNLNTVDIVDENNQKLSSPIDKILFEGKTPMQSAKNAFIYFCPKKSNQTFIFSIQENGGNNKIYSYKGTRAEKDSTVVIKAYKPDNAKEVSKKQAKTKSVKKVKSQDYEDDGIVIQKKVVPPLAKDGNKKSKLKT